MLYKKYKNLKGYIKNKPLVDSKKKNTYLKVLA